MTSFIATTNLTTSQSLLNSEIGVVTDSGGVFATSGTAIAMSGSTRLSVFGDVVSQTSSAVFVNSLISGSVNVGQGASLISAAAGGSALSGSIAGELSVNNAGQMMGGAGVALTLSNSTATLSLANGGRISATSPFAAVSLTFLGTATATVSNSGVIEGTGSADGLAFTGPGTVNLSNSGLISVANPAQDAIYGTGGLRMENTGTIIGDIDLTGASVLNTRGTIMGDVQLGEGNDKVSVSGLVQGSINLGNGTNSFDLRGGTVTGTVTGGTGWDSYVVDQQNVQIVDHGGTQDYLQSYVNITIAQGIEVTSLVGATGLVAVGSNLGETVYGDRGGDTIMGEGGGDNLFGGIGDDVLSGGAGDDIVSGDAGDDLLRGGAGDDVFLIWTGADVLRGGAGADAISLESLFGEVPVVVNLANGTARVEADTALTLSGIENVYGSGYGDVITGDGQNNMLDGGSGNDKLTGAAGADTLKGGDGADSLNGGAGADSFVFADVSWSRASAGIDQIAGFAKAEDVIDLSQIDATPGGSDSAFVFIGAQGFSGTGPQVRAVVDVAGQTTTIQVRLDGSVTNDMVIVLDNDMVLTVDNFIL